VTIERFMLRDDESIPTRPRASSTRRSTARAATLAGRQLICAPEFVLYRFREAQPHPGEPEHVFSDPSCRDPSYLLAPHAGAILVSGLLLRLLLGWLHLRTTGTLLQISSGDTLRPFNSASQRPERHTDSGVPELTPLRPCAMIAAHGNRFLLAHPDDLGSPGSGLLLPAICSAAGASPTFRGCSCCAVLASAERPSSEPCPSAASAAATRLAPIIGVKHHGNTQEYWKP